MEAVRLEEGALWCRLYEDLEDPAAYGLSAGWGNEAALECHLRSERFGVLLRALEVLAQPARMEFLLPVGSGNLSPAMRALQASLGEAS